MLGINNFCVLCDVGLSCCAYVRSVADVKNVGGKAVTDKLEAGLVRSDKGRIYPIKEGIPVLLIDEGIDL